MTDKAAPDCSACRFLWHVLDGLGCQLSGSWIDHERRSYEHGKCGPSGRYFEPREDTPAK